MEKQEIAAIVEEATPVEVPKKKKAVKKEIVEEVIEQEHVSGMPNESEQVEEKPTHEENLQALSNFDMIDETMQEIAPESPPSNDLNIGEAMKALKEGKFVARRAWLNKYIKHHYHDSFDNVLPEGIIVDDNGFNCLLSHTDLLSNDWYILNM